MPTKRTVSEERREPKDRTHRLERLGRAIREARESKGMTQVQLGEALAPHLGAVPLQTTISRWEKGQVSLDVEQIWAIETALDLEQGSLLYRSGYLDARTGPRDIETLLRSDPAIEDTLREIAVAGYRQWVQASRKMKRAD